jgi:hypothetical protein
VVTTRAITVRATVADVWPWIAQLGQGRGGLYSYDRIENLLGCDIHSADRIHPEWQAVQVGDEVRLAPEMALIVAVADPPRALVLRGGDLPMGSLRSPFDFTWAFTLHPVPGVGTRLVVRERYAYRSWWAALLVRPTSLVSAVMSRRMLRGIRDRVEGRPLRRRRRATSLTRAEGPGPWLRRPRSVTPDVVPRSPVLRRPDVAPRTEET